MWNRRSIFATDVLENDGGNENGFAYETNGLIAGFAAVLTGSPCEGDTTPTPAGAEKQAPGSDVHESPGPQTPPPDDSLSH